MKLCCYLVLMMVVLMMIRSNPAMTLIIFAVIIGSYVYLKKRKKGGVQKGLFGSGRVSNRNEMNDLLLLLVLNQLGDEQPPRDRYMTAEERSEKPAKRKYQEQADELLGILED